MGGLPCPRWVRNVLLPLNGLIPISNKVTCETWRNQDVEKNLRPTPSPKAGSKLCRQKRGETLSPPSRQPFPQPSQSGHDWGDAPAREGDRLNVLPPLCWLFSYRRGHEVVTLLALSPRTGVPTQRNPEMPAQACGLRTHKLSQRPQGWGDSTPRGHTTRAWLSPRGGGGDYWHRVGGGQGCCPTPHHEESSPWRATWSKRPQCSGEETPGMS